MTTAVMEPKLDAQGKPVLDAQGKPVMVEQTSTVNPETHDPATGKSWKDLAKEHQRKGEESQAKLDQSEAERGRGPTEQKPGETTEEYRQRWEREFADDPFKTIHRTIGVGATHIVNRTRKEIVDAGKMLRSVKTELKKLHTDFAEYETEFDQQLEGIDVVGASEDRLRALFYEIRGRKLSDKLRAAGGGGSETHIVGEPASPGAPPGPVAPSGEQPLTEAQQSEFKRLGDLSEAGYRRALKERQDRARKMNAKVIPETLGEPIVRPQI